MCVCVCVCVCVSMAMCECEHEQGRDKLYKWLETPPASLCEYFLLGSGLENTSSGPLPVRTVRILELHCRRWQASPNTGSNIAKKYQTYL